MSVYDSRGARDGLAPVTFLWGFGAAAATLATSQTIASGTDWGAVLIALITALGAVAAAYVASRRRGGSQGPPDLGDDEMIVKRRRWEQLEALERRHRAK